MRLHEIPFTVLWPLHGPLILRINVFIFYQKSAKTVLIIKF